MASIWRSRRPVSVRSAIERRTMSPPILAGAEPWSHTVSVEQAAGFLALHGFTGNPSSMRGVAEAVAGAGFHVELPRLPGHGTSVEDMLATRWDDWTGEVEAAYQRLAQRTERIVVGGLSMGGSLALWTGLQHADVNGLVCINPATTPQAPEVMEMLQATLAEGNEVMPGIGSDIADPESVEIAYDGTPVRPLLSLLDDGLAPMADRYSELKMPLLLYTSRQDHVVEPTQSEHLAENYGGEVDHRWLERSYHVATQDYDRETIFAGAIEFARQVTAH
jgi:carboxylesterase